MMGVTVKITKIDRDECQLAQARKLLAWYGPGTVQHTFAKSELERLARSGQEHGEETDR